MARQMCPPEGSAQISVSQGVQVIIELLTGLQETNDKMGTHYMASAAEICVCQLLTSLQGTPMAPCQ